MPFPQATESESTIKVSIQVEVKPVSVDETRPCVQNDIVKTAAVPCTAATCKNEDKQTPLEHASTFPLMSQIPSRRKSAAEIEENLSRIPGHVSSIAIAVNEVAQSEHLRSAERLQRIRQQHDANLAQLKQDLFQSSDELAKALADVERRKQWRNMGIYK